MCDEEETGLGRLSLEKAISATGREDVPHNNFSSFSIFCAILCAELLVAILLFIYLFIIYFCFIHNYLGSLIPSGGLVERLMVKTFGPVLILVFEGGLQT